MNRTRCFLLLLSLLILQHIVYSTANALEESPNNGHGVNYDYLIEFGRDCVAEVRVLVRTWDSEARAWMLLPRLEKGFSTNASLTKVEGANLEGRRLALYVNVSLHLIRGTTAAFNYSLPHVCLVHRGKAVFLSPLMVFSPGGSGTVSVNVNWPGSSFAGADAALSSVRRSDDGFGVTRRLPLLSGRLSFVFSVPEEELREYVNGSLTFVLPERYSWIAERLTAFNSKLSGKLAELFQRKPSRLTVSLFLPDRYDEGPEGFVTPPNGDNTGRISLNLYLLRMVDGMLEVTFLHELIHQYLFANGVGAGATWLHEGLATYLSVSLAMGTGLEAPAYVRELFDRENASLQELRGLLGWRPGEERGRRWYAMAYRAVELLFSADSDGMRKAVSSLGDATVRTPEDAAVHVFDHLNAEGRSLMIEMGLVSAQGLAQEIGSEPMTPRNETPGSAVMNGTAQAVQGIPQTVTHEHLVLVLATVLTVSVIALILIDVRRT